MEEIFEYILEIDKRGVHLKTDRYTGIELVEYNGIYVVHNLHTELPNIVKIFESYSEALEEFKEWTRAFDVEEKEEKMVEEIVKSFLS